MQARDFCFWLQGVFEVAKPTNLDQSQIDLIQAHLNLVFKHEIDPSMGSPAHQKLLDGIHQSGDQFKNTTLRC